MDLHHIFQIEKIDFPENYATFVSLLPISSDIQSIFKSALEECNQLGNFLQANFLVTNVKVFSNDEIKKFLEEKNDKFDDETDSQADEIED